MKKPLLDVIFASEKRMNMMLMLQDGPRPMEEILEQLEVARPALLPQVRILEEHYLVKGSNDIYELTPLGKMVIDKMTPLMGTIEVFQDDTEYWGTHHLGFIPPHLFERIREIGKCQEVNLTLTESYQLNQEVVRTTFMSKAFHVITSFFHPNYPRVFPEMNREGVSLHIITTPGVIETMRTYHADVFGELLKSESFHLYTYPEEMGIQVVAYNDYYLLLRLLTNEKYVDINHMLCSNPGALQWGKELFDHYMKGSQPVTKL
ncbi:helix-turn-helix transcriptional regulator [Methanolobus chelungpuianus]|uniref:Transcriptional regulator n=1 Tax=Methanolobus chelungpuianus TaxID=502115 RepID=A0AAE3KY16_9EURY|nr:winged helix-turn-helix domain-containing protein [Methanolobus chelungpuianus]MCQ6963530.1 transcriptional regulator [Methanolobus chelungpuianus]